MKKHIILIAMLVASGVAYSQVGVNTETPKTTMDISAKRDGAGVITDNTQTYGLQAPRLTRAELTANTATYGTDQRGALVYITDISGGNTTGQRANITATGYYYFDGGFWQKVSNGAIPTGVDITDDAFINDATNTMVKLGTRADGATARDAGTDFVIKDAGNVGIGTANPNAKLDVLGTINATDNITVRRATEGGQVTLQGQNAADMNWTIDQISDLSNPRFRIFGGSNEENGITIEEEGNVGIGVLNATHKLHVDGKIRGTHLTNGSANVGSTDLGLFNQTSGMFNRYVTNAAPHQFFVDGATGNNFIGTTPAMVIDTNSNVGIGTNSPSTKLHINASAAGEGFRLVDGTQGSGKVLSSDGSGNAQWVTNVAVTPVVFGDMDTSNTLFTLNEHQYVGDRITLRKGKWLVYIGKLLDPASVATSTNNVWVRLSLSSSETSNVETGFSFLSSRIVSGWLEQINRPTGRYTFLSGVIPVNVTDDEIILYLRTREYSTLGTPPTVRTQGTYGENYLFAVPTN